MVRCLKSIKEYAFCASNYPLVITLEDHLTADLQAKVAKVKFTYCIIFFLCISSGLKHRS
jgi:phosphatidylinositol phospholipase C delta